MMMVNQMMAFVACVCVMMITPSSATTTLRGRQLESDNNGMQEGREAGGRGQAQQQQQHIAHSPPKAAWNGSNVDGQQCIGQPLQLDGKLRGRGAVVFL